MVHTTHTPSYLLLKVSGIFRFES